MDRRVWWATVHRLTEWDTTEVTALTHTHTHTQIGMKGEFQKREKRDSIGNNLIQLT